MKKSLFHLLSVTFFMAAAIALFSVAAYAYSEHEQNGSANTANAIPLNETVYASYDSSVYEDEDYFKFTLPQDGTISVTMNHGYRDLFTGMNFSLMLDGEVSNTMFSYDFPWNAETVTSTRMGLKAGTYFFRSWYYPDDQDIPYQFKVNYTPDNCFEMEPNGSIKKATEMPLNKEFSCMTWRNDEDYLMFTLPNDGAVSFTFNQPYNANDYDMDMTLLSYDGTTETRYETFYFGNASETKTTYKIGLKAGSYYLDVSGAHYLDTGESFEYGVIVNYEQTDSWEKELNENIKTATPVNVNQTCYGSASYNDTDYYSFTLSEDASLTTQFSHGFFDDSFYVDITILSYDGTQEITHGTSSFSNTGENYKTDKIDLPAGDYLIQIETNRRDPFEYTFVLDTLNGAQGTTQAAVQSGSTTTSQQSSAHAATKAAHSRSLMWILIFVGLAVAAVIAAVAAIFLTKRS